MPQEKKLREILCSLCILKGNYCKISKCEQVEKAKSAIRKYFLEELKSIMPDLVEQCFPKGQCKERGQALVLVGLICVHFVNKERLNGKKL